MFLSLLSLNVYLVCRKHLKYLGVEMEQTEADLHDVSNVTRRFSPLWEEGINYPITKRIYGQLRNPLKVFSTDKERKREIERR